MTWSRPELEQHWTPMVRAAVAVLGSRDEAEECAALALVQVLERQPEAENMQAFMVTVARRRAIDRLRDLERGRARHLKLAAMADAHVGDVAEDIVARAEARWIDGEARRQLRPQVYDLLRRIADGQPMADAAEALGMTERAASSHLRRARVLLRSALAKTLGVLALGAGWRRRNLGGAAVAGLTATALLITVPFVGGAPGEGARPGATGPALESRQVHTAPLPHAVGASGAAALSAASGRTTSGGSAARPPGHGSSWVVHEPLGASTTVTHEQHGSGPEAGPVGTVTECVDNLTVSLTRIGC